MALQTLEFDGGGFLHKFLLQLLGGQPEGHVHVGAIFSHGGAAVVAARTVDGGVQMRGLVGVYLGQGSQATLLIDPARDQHDQVDGEARRRVVHRAFSGVGLVAEDGRYFFRRALQQVLADGHQGHPGRAHVLLRAGIDQPELAEVQRTGEDVRRHIGHQRSIHGGDALHLRALNGLVGGDVQVGRARGQLEFRGLGHAGRLLLADVGRHVDFADVLAFLDGLAAPGAGIDVVRGLPLAQQVHGHQGELGAGSAGLEQDGEVVAQAHQALEVGRRLGLHGVVLLAAVAHFHEGHARAFVVHQLGLGFDQDFFGQYGGTGAEVEYA